MPVLNIFTFMCFFAKLKNHSPQNNVDSHSSGLVESAQTNYIYYPSSFSLTGIYSMVTMGQSGYPHSQSPWKNLCRLQRPFRMPNQWCQSSKDTMLNITNCSKQQWLSTEGTRLLPSKPRFISHWYPSVVFFLIMKTKMKAKR